MRISINLFTNTKIKYKQYCSLTNQNPKQQEKICSLALIPIVQEKYKQKCDTLSRCLLDWKFSVLLIYIISVQLQTMWKNIPSLAVVLATTLKIIETLQLEEINIFWCYNDWSILQRSKKFLYLVMNWLKRLTLKHAKEKSKQIYRVVKH